ncbi:MAG: cache domain-containing protein, partial [Desulfobacterales bacterium]|nr:cache domain-containing protein [Desulfobacterales bacterium]
IIKQEVQRVVDLINLKKSQSEEIAKAWIKSRVYEAYAVAQHIYQQNQFTKSAHEIQQMIIAALSPIRFEQGKGYYFISRTDGVAILFPSKPEMEGVNLIDVQDTRGQHLTKDMIEIVEQKGEGFYQYHWTKPETAGDDFEKVSFIKRLDLYGWFIGAGLYVNDVERQITEDLLLTISRIRFGKEGYVFVNRLNGDALVSNGALVIGSKKLWEVFDDNPEKIKNLFEKEYNAAMKPEGDYIYYSLVKLNAPDKEAPKVSFIYGIPELEWLVGAGVYLDDVETDIARMHSELYNHAKKMVLYFILIILGIIVFSIILFSRLNRKLKNDFNLFVSFFNRAAVSDEPINRDLVQFIELDRMAENANKMLSDRKQAEDSLKVSEKKYRSILDSIEDGYYEMDFPGNLTFFNNSMCKLLGYSKDELMGMNIRQYMDHDNAEKVFRFFNMVHDDGKTLKEIGLELIRKDGSGCYVETSISPLASSEGQLIGFQGIVRDISERKRMEDEKVKVEHLFRQAEKMEAIGVLAGGVAHDLNNILSGIVGYPDLLLLQLPENSPLRRPIAAIQESGIKAAAIVRDLLTLAKRGVATYEVLNVNDIVSEYLKSPEYEKLKSSHPDIEVNASLDAGLLNILGSPVHILNTIMNLVLNSAEAISEKGNIFIGTKNQYIDRPVTGYEKIEEGDYVTLTVSDTGNGIHSQDIRRIFEPFYTKKKMGKSGTGLGMTVVWGTVKDHKGYIDVQSAEGKGSVFTLYFPITRQEKAQEQLNLSVDTYMSRGETVLVVDDVRDQRELVSAMLNILGYSVTAVASGEAAAEYLQKNSVDVIILDMIMDPGMDGLDTYKQILKFRPGQKAIIASGYSETIRVQEVQRLGAGKYIRKPYTLEKIGLAIKEELSK